MKNMTKTRVALVDMGERLPIDLNKLSGKLNSKLNSKVDPLVKTFFS